jgi:hypothetical protein
MSDSLSATCVHRTPAVGPSLHSMALAQRCDSRGALQPAAPLLSSTSGCLVPSPPLLGRFHVFYTTWRVRIQAPTSQHVTALLCHSRGPCRHPGRRPFRRLSTATGRRSEESGRRFHAPVLRHITIVHLQEHPPHCIILHNTSLDNGPGVSVLGLFSCRGVVKVYT